MDFFSFDTFYDYGICIYRKQQQPCFAYIEPVESSYEITMKQDLLCLMMAYPEHIESVEKLEGQVYVTMKSEGRYYMTIKKQRAWRQMHTLICRI